MCALFRCSFPDVPKYPELKGVFVMPETLTATTHVEVTRLAGQIGAEINGADTGTPLSDEVIARIRQALLDHKVVFLRDQRVSPRRRRGT